MPNLFCYSYLNHVKFIVAREKITKNYLEAIGVDKKLMHLSLDTAFLLPAANTERVNEIFAIENISYDNKKPFVGI